MGKRKICHSDFIGTRIGKVVVSEFSHVVRVKERDFYYYSFICDCGNSGTGGKHTLLQAGKTRKNTYCCETCRKDKLAEWAKTAHIKYKDPVEGKCAILFSNYRSKCKSKQWKFELTFEEFKNLVTSNCHYCNLEPNKSRQERAASRQNITPIYFNGIDRKDSGEGYIHGNCLPCCEDCNKAKRSLSYEMFLSLVEKIYKHRVLERDS
jgi:hypothetical protein